MTELQRFLTFAAATAALGVALVVLVPRLLGASEPGGEVLTALKVLERDARPVPLATGLLRPGALHYQRMEVRLEPGGEEALVTATLDLEAVLERPGEAESTRVSSLGLERVRFIQRGGSWAPEAGGWPRLAAALAALEQRRLALDAEAARGASGRRYRVRAWYLRSEREAVAVAEDWRLEGSGGKEEQGTTRLELPRLADGGLEWRQ
jgi:hypothetical protein